MKVNIVKYKEESYLVIDLGSYNVPDQKEMMNIPKIGIPKTGKEHLSLLELWDYTKRISKKQYTETRNLVFFLPYNIRKKRITAKEIKNIINSGSTMLWWEKHLTVKPLKYKDYLEIVWTKEMGNLGINLREFYTKKLHFINIGYTGIRTDKKSGVFKWVRKYWILQNYEIMI